MFVLTRRVCLALQHRDRDKLLHGYETGTIIRLPSGEFIEIHAPVSDEERAVLLAHEQYRPVELETQPDENGVAPKVTMLDRARAKLSRAYFGEQVDQADRGRARARRPPRAGAQRGLRPRADGGRRQRDPDHAPRLSRPGAQRRALPFVQSAQLMFQSV